MSTVAKSTIVKPGHRAVVTTMSGGCGGVCYTKKTFPAGVLVEQTEMGELYVKDESGAVTRFGGREWFNWQEERIAWAP